MLFIRCPSLKWKVTVIIFLHPPRAALLLQELSFFMECPRQRNIEINKSTTEKPSKLIKAIKRKSLNSYINEPLICQNEEKSQLSYHRFSVALLFEDKCYFVIHCPISERLSFDYLKKALNQIYFPAAFKFSEIVTPRTLTFSVFLHSPSKINYYKLLLAKVYFRMQQFSG